MTEPRFVRAALDEKFPRQAAQEDARRLADAGLHEVDVANAEIARDALDLGKP